MLAEKLGIGCAINVNKITYDENSKEIVVDRKLEDGIETVALTLPALVSVLPDINTPRIPSLKQVLGAAKKPVHSITPDAPGEPAPRRLETVSVAAATMDRRRVKFAADAEGIRAVVNTLMKEGIIS